MNYKGYKQLQYNDRLKIEGALRTGARVADIAREIGVCKKTIYNEIKRGLCVQQREGYFSRRSIAPTWRRQNTRKTSAQKGRT